VAAPKPKYIEPILLATTERSEFRSVMIALQNRLGDTAWSIVYKALLVIHIMIREGESDVTLKYLSNHLHFFDLNQIRQIGSPDGKQLLRYSKYLAVRSKQYGNVAIDYVRDEQVNKKEGGRLRNLSIDKGLLREVESVEKQIRALVNCKFNEADINNDIVLTCFRMLVNDLLCLYQSLNEGVINILEHYFEMSKYDAERALVIYKEFVMLTKDVVNYLRIAKHLEYATKLHVPTIRHAPTALANSLEEYLHDENFEVNRKQYLAERELKSNGKKSNSEKVQHTATGSNYNPWNNQIGLQSLNLNGGQQQPQVQPIQQQQQQQPLVPQQTSNPFLQMQNTQTQPQQYQFQQQPTGFQPQQSQSMPVPIQQAQTFNIPGNQFQFQQQPTGFQPQHQQQQQQPNGLQQSYTTGGIVPTFTGAGFGGYTGQPQPAQQMQPQLTQQTTGNPFVPSVTNTTSSNNQPKPLESSKTGNNPFAIDYKPKLSSISEPQNNNYSGLQSQQTSSNPFSQPSTNSTTPTTLGLTSQATGTNPFQKSYTSNRISVNGSTTNPLKPQATFGGYENLPTNPVFPQTIQQQHTNQFQQKASWDLQQQMLLNQQQQQRQQQEQQFQSQQNAFQQQPTGNQFNYQQYEGPSLI